MSDRAIIDEVLRLNPLARFSVYTHLQVDTVAQLSTEVLELLDHSISGNSIDGRSFQRIYGLFWLWVIGAYEVVRTMSEHKDCFSESLQIEIASFKRSISTLRIPFAKQQLRGRGKEPISHENSVYGIDIDKRDMSFKIEGSVMSMREILQSFDEFVKSIAENDVLLDLRKNRIE